MRMLADAEALGRRRELPRTRVVEEHEWAQDRTEVRVGEQRPHGEAFPTQCRSALRWMQRSFFGTRSRASKLPRERPRDAARYVHPARLGRCRYRWNCLRSR